MRLRCRMTTLLEALGTMQDDDGAENEEIQGRRSCPCYFRTDPGFPEATPAVAGVESTSKLGLHKESKFLET